MHQNAAAARTFIDPVTGQAIRSDAMQCHCAFGRRIAATGIEAGNTPAIGQVFRRDAVKDGVVHDPVDLKGIHVEPVQRSKRFEFRQHRPGDMAVEDQRPATVQKMLYLALQATEKPLVQMGRQQQGAIGREIDGFQCVMSDLIHVGNIVADIRKVVSGALDRFQEQAGGHVVLHGNGVRPAEWIGRARIMLTVWKRP